MDDSAPEAEAIEYTSTRALMGRSCVVLLRQVVLRRSIELYARMQYAARYDMQNSSHAMSPYPSHSL